jgi:hypothetical protein
MTRTKTPAAPSAAHAAPDPAPAPDAVPAPGSPAAAVCAALAANPGTTVAVIAAAAGTGRPAARDALLAMEAAGTATRGRGGKPGIPDTWTLAGTRPASGGPAPRPENEQDRLPADGDETRAGGTGQDDTAGPASPERHHGGAGSRDGAPPGPAAGQAARSHDGTSGDRASAVPGEQDDEAVPADEAVPDGGPQDEDAGPADGDGGTGDAPDPALVSEIIERIGQIKAAADAAGTVLTAGGNLGAALAGLDEIAGQAGQARRSLKAAIGGRKAPAARPGGLRERVLAHLRGHPGKEFTPHEIHKVLGNSSGAIANALDTLARHGDAEVSCDKPRRFRLAGTAPKAAGASNPADGAGGGTELAGAA